ncbi:response regulator [Patescibacteria group bacterium]|nr:response regulator [Patescibacteria group bacterium]MBU1868379.1 response regulator [Patescibacteria group bacterium]
MKKQNRILIVEDDKMMCDLYTEVLNHEGFEVDVARDGLAGFEKMKANIYDLVILSVMLPDMNGIEVLEKFNTTGKKQGKIIYLTGLCRQELIDQIFELGAVGYEFKGAVTPDEVVLWVRAHLDGKVGIEEAKQRASERVRVVRSLAEEAKEAQGRKSYDGILAEETFRGGGGRGCRDVEREGKKPVSHREFVEGYSAGIFEVLVNRQKAGDFVLSRFGRTEQKLAHYFWGGFGIIMLSLVPLILLFIRWSLAPICFFIGCLIISATRKSAAGFVVQNMLEDEDFWDFVLLHGGASVKDNEGREIVSEFLVKMREKHARE